MGNVASAADAPEDEPHRPTLHRRRSSFAMLVSGAFAADQSRILDEHHRSFTGKTDTVDEVAFSKLLGIEELPWFGPRLLAVIRRRAEEEGAGSPAENGLTRDGWYMGVARGCKERRTATLRVLFDVCDEKEAGVLDHAGLSRLFEAAYGCGHAAWGLQPQIKRFAGRVLADNVMEWLVALKGSAAGSVESKWPDGGTTIDGQASDADSASAGGVMSLVGEELPKEAQHDDAGLTVTFTDLVTWVAERAPLIHLCLSTFVHRRVFPAANLPSEVPVYTPPAPLEGSAILADAEEVAFGVSVYTKALQGQWFRLYTSDEDGLSFNRIAYKILGFGGPTLLLLRDKATGAVFGGFADSPWRESNSFYGSSASFVGRFSPSWEIYPCKASADGHFQYLNLKGFSLPHGLGMGGQIGGFRLFLPESLDAEESTARTTCATYERGPLLPDGRKRFEVDAMEVWGVGGTASLREAVQAQAVRRKDVEHAIAKARKVDRAKFAESEFDREMLLGKTFAAAGQRQGGNA